MGTFTNTKEAAEYFEGDRYAMITGVKLEELTDEYSLASLVLGDIHKNANGGIMGGVIFTLADFAFAVLSNHIHMNTVAQQVSINYLGAPKGGTLFADVLTGRLKLCDAGAFVFCISGNSRPRTA